MNATTQRLVADVRATQAQAQAQAALSGDHQVSANFSRTHSTATSSDTIKVGDTRPGSAQPHHITPHSVLHTPPAPPHHPALQASARMRLAARLAGRLSRQSSGVSLSLSQEPEGQLGES